MKQALRRSIVVLVVVARLGLLGACAAPTPVVSPIVATATVLAPTATASPVPVTPSPTPLPSLTPVPTPRPVILYVDPTMDLGPISRFSYGTNYGPWSIVPMELQQQFLDSGITFIRFPGGNWGDQNNLDGPQIDQFIAMARSIQAEPQISVRLLGGDPAYAAALVKYARDKGYNVKYWSIGNEPNLYDTKNKTWPDERFNKEWRAFAQAMRAQDPSIKLIGPEIHQFYPNPPAGSPDAAARETLRQFLQVNGDLVDIVSIHRYPFPKQYGDGPPKAAALVANSQEWDTIIPDLRALIRENTGRDLPIAVTEFNSNWANYCCSSTTPDSTLGALWLADVLGRMMRQKVDIIAQFALRQSQGGLGILGSYDPNPPYYVYQLYKRFGTELLYASSDDPLLMIYAARRADGTLTLVVINLGTQEMTRPLMLKGVDAAAESEVWRFDDQHQATKIGTARIGGGQPLTVPRQSMSLYLIKP